MGHMQLAPTSLNVDIYGMGFADCTASQRISFSYNLAEMVHRHPFDPYYEILQVPNIILCSVIKY